MNIIKFKDLMADPARTDAELFNEKFRGKYAYWIHCRYAVAMEDINIDQAVMFEEQIEDLIESEIQYIDLHIGGGDHWIYTDGYVDEGETDRVNSVEEYMRSNEFVPDDITLDKLKNFRTWLAESLLLFKSELTDNQHHTLIYYSEGMTDETIKWLTEFGQPNINDIKFFESNVSSCGCEGTTNVSSLYSGKLRLCEPINIYKANLHRSMVDMFSNIDFWSDLNKEFLKGIVIYLKGILKSGLSLVTDMPSDSFGCKCLSNKNSAQEIAQGVIEDVIVSFNHIIHDDIIGHKLNISQALLRWSDVLYDIMQWN